jgi:hypothetical protein
MSKPVISPSVKVNIDNLWEAIQDLKKDFARLDDKVDAAGPQGLLERINTIEAVLWGEEK